jgi:ATP-dependent Clp protease ATP-binding subunit ClpX
VSDSGRPTGPQPAGGDARGSIRCSFCGKRGSEVDSIVAGPTPAVAICNECIGLVTGIMAEQPEPSSGDPESPQGEPDPPGDHAA